MSIFGQVWLWSVAAFVLGALLTWVLLVRPARSRVTELERRLAAMPMAPPQPVRPPRDPEPTRVREPVAHPEPDPEVPADAERTQYVAAVPGDAAYETFDEQFDTRAEHAEAEDRLDPYERPYDYNPFEREQYDLADEEPAPESVRSVLEPETYAEPEPEPEPASEPEPAPRPSLFTEHPVYDDEPAEPEEAPPAEIDATQVLPKRQPREAPRGGFDAPEPIQPSMHTVSRREPAPEEGSQSGSLFQPTVEPGRHSAEQPAPPPPPARNALADGALPSGPFGPGSAMPLPGGASPSEDYRVKASVTALRYCTEDQDRYPDMVAEVWFRSPADAERVGFRPLA